MEEAQFQTQLKEKTAEVEELIALYLPETKYSQKTLVEAMSYSILAGGKRLRPILMQEVYRIYGGRGKLVEPFMVAMEMIHTFSLVHDDLPALDNDDMRRGKHTTWSVYGEAMGILAGDGLLNCAMETALLAFEFCEVSDRGHEIGTETALSRYRLCADALEILFHKAGYRGMIGGESFDVEAEKKNLDLGLKEIGFIHERKTAALIQGAMMVGAMLAGAGERIVKEMEKCGYAIGMAFQIQDDILDVVGNAEELGKPIGSDEASHKQTYVTLKGLDQARTDVEMLSEEALKIVAQMPGDHEFMEELVRSLVHRNK